MGPGRDSDPEVVHFTDIDGNEAGVDFVLIQRFLLCNINYHDVFMLTSIFQRNFYKKTGGFYQNKGNLSLTFSRGLGY